MNENCYNWLGALRISIFQVTFTVEKKLRIFFQEKQNMKKTPENPHPSSNNFKDNSHQTFVGIL